MIWARPPNAAAGSPPPITLPNVIKSPDTPSRPYQPDLVTRNPVRTSSMISSAPYSPHKAASRSLKPAAGGTMPMFAGQAKSGYSGAGRGEQCIDVTVITACELHNQPPACVAPGEADGGHRCFGARINQPHPIDRCSGSNLFGKIGLSCSDCAKRQSAASCGLHGGHDRGMGVPEDHWPPGAHQVHVAVAVDVG